MNELTMTANVSIRPAETTAQITDLAHDLRAIARVWRAFLLLFNSSPHR
jgi:hypothetical protein